MRQKSIVISPSICAAKTYDYATLIDQLARAGAKAMHFDIMDASVTPTVGVDPQMLNLVPFDILCELHIMVDNPIKFLKTIPLRQNTYVQTHYRMVSDYESFMSKVLELGLHCGLTIDLDDDLTRIKPLLKQLDFINFMAIDQIGLTNQMFDPKVFAKIAKFHELYPDWKGILSVDGSVREQHLNQLSKLVDQIVVGSILYKQSDWKQGLIELSAI